MIQHENIIDLIPSEDSKDDNNSIYKSLRIKENPSEATFHVEGLAEYKVENEVDCLNLLRIGEQNRLLRLKKVNMDGHRCSTILQLKFHSAFQKQQPSKFNICDLGGSDKISSEEKKNARLLVDPEKLNLSVKAFE